MVPKNPSKFSFNLQRGADVDDADLYFHLSARFGDTPLVVRNTRSGGVWGVEERGGSFPFSNAHPFLLVLTAYLDSYEVEVTGSVSFSFKIRDGLPLSAVTHLSIEGDLTVRAIHIPVESMPRNLRLSIPGKTKVGDMVFLRGTPSAGSQSFVVNIQSGPGKMDDVMLHFNPRLPEKKVVLNSRADDVWGSEEKGGTMPFVESQPFLLVMAASSLGFDTWVDGKEFATFSHRHDMANASTLFIEGDLNTQDIVIDSAQCVLPPQCDDGVKRNTRITRVQVFCPEIPLVSRITGGFDKDCLLVLSGEVSKEPSRFSLNLQCDSCDDSDIALHYNPRWDEPDPILILNSREDDKWGSETRAKDDRFVLVPGSHFDISILAGDDNFRLAANGIHQADFPLRLENTRPDHIVICGDVTVHRLLVV